MKVVIDCNVLVAAARIDGVCRRVIDVVVRRHEIVLTESIVAEYDTVAERPKHATYRDTLTAAIRHLEHVAIVVEPANVTFGLSDQDDEICLATATAGSAVLITGNSRHFTEPRYGSVEAFSPRAFLDGKCAALAQGPRPNSRTGHLKNDNAQNRNQRSRERASSRED